MTRLLKATSSVGRALLPPLIAFALARAMLLIAAADVGLDPSRPTIWCRGDSGLYLAIAIDGYNLFPCPEHEGEPNMWCGNAGWFPAYPWLIRPLRPFIPTRRVAALISAGFALVGLALLWNLLLDGRVSVVNCVTLGLAAFFPGQVYHHAVFPISMFTACALLYLHALMRGRWTAAAIAAAVAAFTYPSGVLLAAHAVLFALLNRRDGRPRARLSGAAFVAGLAVAGFAAVLLVHQISVSAWDAFFRIQSTYGHGLNNPFTTLWTRIARLQGHEPPSEMYPGAQALLVVIWLTGAVVCGVARRRRGSSLDLGLVLFAGLFWLFPLSLGGGLSLYRSEALLLPSVALARHLPRSLSLIFLLAFIVMAWLMALLFFRSQLV
jgi:hypothetical protein